MNNNFDKQVEQKYQVYIRSIAKSILRIGIYYGAVIYGLFSILDIQSLPQTRLNAIGIRFFIVIPSLFSTLFILESGFYEKYYKIILSCLAQFAGFGIVAIIFIANANEFGYLSYYKGLILVILWIHLFFRIGYKLVLLNTLLITLGYNLVAIFKQELLENNILELALNNAFLISANIIGTIASYYYEHSSRKEFILIQEKEQARKNAERKHRKIKQQNRELVNQHMELLQQNEISSQFEALVNQLNPHFLFNSLNTLASLVKSDTEKSVKFIESFSDIYRYILQIRDEVVVNVAKEVEFVEAYFFLQKVRFGKNIKLSINLTQTKNVYILPFTLQLLIENAIKHNEVSIKNPLQISVTQNATANEITILNKIKKISDNHTEEGSGLKNLAKRYKLIVDKETVINKSNNNFEIVIPLIVED